MKKVFALSVIALSASLFCSLGHAAYGSDDSKTPPGLQNKGVDDHPKGLENQGKTPAGWKKGEKSGWDKKHHKHHHHHHKKHHKKHVNDGKY